MGLLKLCGYINFVNFTNCQKKMQHQHYEHIRSYSTQQVRSQRRWLRVTGEKNLRSWIYKADREKNPKKTTL